MYVFHKLPKCRLPRATQQWFVSAIHNENHGMNTDHIPSCHRSKSPNISCFPASVYKPEGQYLKPMSFSMKADKATRGAEP